jgi:predicted DNA-binding transcriptional regulator AlpA
MSRVKSQESLKAEHLRAAGISREVNVHRSTVGRWAAKGYLPDPVETTSTFRVWRKSDIEDWIAKKELATQS